MKPLRFAKQVTKRYGDELSRLLGLPASQVSFNLSRSTDVAETNGRNITLNPDWFKSAGRRDAAGAVVHELTHAYQDAPAAAYAAHGKSYEAIADAARARLGLGSGAGYSSRLERRYTDESNRAFRQDARQLAAGTGGFQVPNAQPGPKPGRGPGHLRNTGANANSKAGKGAYAALAAAQAQGYASQAAGLQSAYTQALMAIKQQRGQVQAAAITGRADVKSQALAAAGAAEGDAASRGIVGSSVDAMNRAGVVEDRAAGLASIAAQKGDALAQLRLQKFGAQTTLNTGLMDLQAQKAADLATLQVQRYQDGLTAQANFDFKAAYQDALKRLLARGKKPPGTDPRGDQGDGGWQFSPAYPGMGPRPGDPEYDWRTSGVGGPVHSAGPHPQ
jgi:hypothetical protein